MKILFVCTGNVCRSPMAEGFLRHEAKARSLDLEIQSVGTHAFPGRRPTIDARRVMNEFGAPIDDLWTKELEPSHVQWADLVLCLAREHERWVLNLCPEEAGKVFRLKEFVLMLPGLPPEGSTTEWLSAAVAGRLAEDPDRDVDDPIGEREPAYRRVGAEVRELVIQLAAGLQARSPSETIEKVRGSS